MLTHLKMDPTTNIHTPRLDFPLSFASLFMILSYRELGKHAVNVDCFVIFKMENFDVIAENVVGAIIKQACQGVEDRLGEHFSYYEPPIIQHLCDCQTQWRAPVTRSGQPTRRTPRPWPGAQS